MYKRKTVDTFVIMWSSSYWQEEIDSFNTRAECKKMIAEYRMAMREFRLWIVKKRVAIEG